MKQTIALGGILFSLSVFAQSSPSSEEFMLSCSQDSSHIRILRDTTSVSKTQSVAELFIIGKNSYKKGSRNPSGQYPPFKGHWTGFNYGFVNFSKIPEEWKALELNWSNSFAMQFNIMKYNVNLVPRNNFGLVTGFGLEYQRLKFNQDNLSIVKKDGELTLIDLRQKYPGIASVKRNTFKTLYLTIPILLEVQFPAHCKKRVYVSGGIMGGIRLHSKTKIVYKNEQGNRHKVKDKGDFNMVPFKADALAKIGYRKINLWGSYTLTSMFKANHSPKLHPYTIGLGVSF